MSLMADGVAIILASSSPSGLLLLAGIALVAAIAAVQAAEVLSALFEQLVFP